MTKFELDNSIDGIVVRAYLAESSSTARKQSALRSEIDVTGDSKADFVIAAQSPYEEGRLESIKGRKLCGVDANYQSVRGGGLITIDVPGDCLRYPLSVSATHTFIVSTDEERAVDTFGSLTNYVARPLLRANASGVIKRSGTVISLVADPSYAGAKAAVQVQRGRSWVTIARASVSPDGEATFRSKASVRKGAKAQVVWGGKIHARFRLR